ncbi:MAG TPA: hypothetical protein VM802_07255 [Chitinophaga sp.]|uniref:hypothetical protein n=1 Tax=Chitinophaga sp. TaxID=1869181 RepID=UPI002C538C54|nr:hypothetical protein [Chitinophaga sp.]HVI44648.1 hypothetical protein [Chitinophaga sp.]
MPEELALFDILISAERNTEERLQALNDLRPFLETDEAVTRLAAAVRTETTIAIKQRMLELLADVDIARLTDRAAYINAFAHVACLEPERALRWMAVQRLAAIAAYDDEVQEILAETMLHDLDTDIQLASVEGLTRCVRKTDDTITKIATYIPQAAFPVRYVLLQLVRQLKQPHAAKLAVLFLGPLEREGIRLEAVNFISGFAAWDTETLLALTAMLPLETSLPVRDAVIRLLSGIRQMDADIFAGIFAALRRMPDQPELLSLVAGRLTAYPELETGFSSLFGQTTSAGLKIKLLALLQHSDLPALIITALKDTNPYVREAVLPLLTNKFQQYREQLEPALAAAIQAEPLAALRSALVTVILLTGRKSSQTEDLLITLALSETDHRLKVRLTEAVLQIAVTDHNRKALLKVCCEILEGAYFPESLKQQVTARLQTFAYTDEPELKRSMGLLLEQSKDIYELDRIYQVLKTLEADFKQLAPSLITALYRHIAWYPQQPLHEWVQLLGGMAEQDATVRGELPYIISLTGATWLLKGTDKADQTGAFLPAFKQTISRKNGMSAVMDAQRLMQDAWNNRTLKKAEVIELYSMLLRMPKSGAYLQPLVQIMTTGKLTTPELVQLSLDYLLVAQDRENIYTVRKYLEQTGHIDSAYREKLLSLFTQEHYSTYMLHNQPEIHSKKRWNTLNDWEYQGWGCPYHQWPVAELVFAMEPGEAVYDVFSNLPVDAPDSAATLPYLILEHLFRNPSGMWGKYLSKDTANTERWLRTLYNGYRQLSAANPPGDRMLYVFWKQWNNYVQRLNGSPVSQDLADAAADIYLGVCGIVKQLEPAFQGKSFPALLKGMSVENVKLNWPWSQELWEVFEYKYFPEREPDHKAAEQLFQEAAKTLRAGDLAAGKQMLLDLVNNYGHTRLVKEQLPNINNALVQLEKPE